jgi:hypothetical protein
VNEDVTRQPLLSIGVTVTLFCLGIAGAIGLIAVVEADHVAGAFGTGMGIAVLVFILGATVACALACLARGITERLALAALAASGLTLDLSVLEIWRGIGAEAYSKTLGVLAVVSFYSLVVLGLRLAIGRPSELGRGLYLGAFGVAIVAAAISAWLVVSPGGSEVASELPATVTDSDSAIPTASGSGLPFYTYVNVGDDGLLRILGGALVLTAVLWFGALAASRVPRAPADV